ncbi:MAG: hypothetical protein M3441_27345 [Chloroflexota bacterium]|nr:hypothetical protein [Chloroflexota bacterium]
MANPTDRVFNVSDSRLLSELAGIEEDLQATVMICRKLEVAWTTEPVDTTLIEALSAAAVVRYWRCFGSGVRRPLPLELLEDLRPKQRELHALVRDLRNKYVAHSVSAFEDNNVLLELSMPPDAPNIMDISVDHWRLAGLKADMARALGNVAERLAAKVYDLFTAERQRVLALARSLPLTDIYALPTPPDPIAEWRIAGQKRPTRYV